MGLVAEIRPGEGLARVGLRLSGVLLLACLAGAVTCGCPRPRDCTPATQRCEADTPVVCSAEGRSWRVSGDPRVTCAQIGGVCVVREGRAYCAAPDAGVVADGGAL